MSRRLFIKAGVAAAALAFAGAVGAQSKTVKVGVLHSLSGTMAISETVLKDVVLMAVEEINAKGGVMGYQIEPVVVDPASNWPLFAEKSRQLLTQDKVAVVFGCWTSVSRKSVLPVCSTKAKRSRRTCSTPAPRPTSRRSRRSST
jgi:urea transport system substrate-binding protein